MVVEAEEEEEDGEEEGEEEEEEEVMGVSSVMASMSLLRGQALATATRKRHSLIWTGGVLKGEEENGPFTHTRAVFIQDAGEGSLSSLM